MKRKPQQPPSTVQCHCGAFWTFSTDPHFAEDQCLQCPACAGEIQGWAGKPVPEIEWDRGGAMVGLTCRGCGQLWNVARKDVQQEQAIAACIHCDESIKAVDSIRWERMLRMAAKKKTSEKNGSDRHEIERYEENLPCKIPDSEISTKAEALAQVIDERAQTKERRRTVMAQFREKLTHYDERIKELGESVRLKTERRPVMCAEFLIDRQNKVEIVRLDTGVVIKTRAANPEDRQEDMFEGERKRKKKNPDEVAPEPDGRNEDGL